MGPAVDEEMIEYRSASSAVPPMALGCSQADISESVHSAQCVLTTSLVPNVVHGVTAGMQHIVPDIGYPCIIQTFCQGVGQFCIETKLLSLSHHELVFPQA